MTDEEKEAKLELNRYIYGKNLIKDEIVDYLGIIFALIDKQQKEIEELKETLKCTQNSWYEDTKIIDKIKAEIKELQNMKVDGEVFTTSVNYAIKVLQSLLENGK